MARRAGRLVGSVQRLIATAQNGLEVIRFGGLDGGDTASPFDVIERRPMYRLRRYYPFENKSNSPAALLIPPLMLTADIYDVNLESGAVAALHRAGTDVWVVDFGSPDVEEGGRRRDLADHVVAVSEALDTVHAHTGRDVHLMGYSQGGMFAYQTAAYRHGKAIASIVTFGSPVDLVAGTPLGLPAGLVSRGADFLADHVVNRLPITDGMVRTGFQLIDPVKTVKARVDFIRQLHDREALLPRERQRRFLASEGWVGYAGPAVADLLRQFVVHNRMMSGGFVIRDQLVSLAELTCPILAFVGEYDDIGQPAAVRGIFRAAPRAQVYEVTLSAGHFGLVAGSAAGRDTWPAVAGWLGWLENAEPLPAQVSLMSEHDARRRPATAMARAVNTAASAAEVGLGVGRSLATVAGQAMRGTVELSGEAARALPRLARLDMISGRTRISLGSLLAEQGHRAPLRECFLFDDRVHTNLAVNTRIDNVVRGLIEVGIRPADRVGVLMETRPSALVAVAALSRLGAVAVLLAPGSDLPAAMELTSTTTLMADPDNLLGAAATGARVLVLGGGGERGLDLADGINIIDLEKVDPGQVQVPGWYIPNPGLARELAFILVSGTGERLEAKYITNHRWALSAYGTAGSADLDRNDTVYCLAPLHHSSGLLVSLGGAVAGGSRIALSRSLEPARFAEEVRRYGVTVVTYTWTMLREILDAELFTRSQHPIRLFIGSGMPAGLWRSTIEHFEPAGVLEFYASTEGDVVLANVAGIKIGCKGRPVPGTAHVELAAYDPVTGTFFQDDAGFVRRCEDGEVGLLLGKAGRSDMALGVMRGVFAPGDCWRPTENLFRRDADGDYWLVDRKDTVAITGHGAVYAQPVLDILDDLMPVDLDVAYGAEVNGRVLAVAAVSLREGYELNIDDLTKRLGTLRPQKRPDLVYVLPHIPVSSSFRPSVREVRAMGLPKPGSQAWYHHPADGTYLPLDEAAAAQLYGTD